MASVSIPVGVGVAEGAADAAAVGGTVAAGADAAAVAGGAIGAGAAAGAADLGLGATFAGAGLGLGDAAAGLGAGAFGLGAAGLSGVTGGDNFAGAFGSGLYGGGGSSFSSFLDSGSTGAGAGDTAAGTNAGGFGTYTGQLAGLSGGQLGTATTGIPIGQAAAAAPAASSGLFGTGLSIPNTLLASSALQGVTGLISSSQQQAALQNAINTQKQFYGSNMALLAPWIGGGANAFNQLQSLTGTGPGGNPLTAPLTKPFQPTQQQLEQTPGYQFTLAQGLKGTQNSAAAQGLGISGPALSGAANYATGLANSTFNQQLQNYLQQNAQIANILGMQSGQGLSAAGALSGQGLQFAGNIGQAQVGQGNAAAAGTGAVGGGAVGGLNNLLGLTYLSAMSPQVAAMLNPSGQQGY